MYPLQDRVHQQFIGLKKLYKEINCKLSPTPSHEEVGYAFIITRGVRPNTYPMDSAHQRYRCIHYFCLIHLKPQPPKGTPKVKAYSLQVALFSNNHNCTVHQHWLLPHLWLYQHIRLVLYQFPDICKCSLLAEPQRWGLLQVCFLGGGKAPWGSFPSHSDWPHRAIVTLVWYNPDPTYLAPHSLGPPTAGMGLGKKNDRKRTILSAPDVAHKTYKKVKNESLLDQPLSGIVLNPERIASTPRTKGDSLRLCWSQSTASHASSGT